MAVTILRKLLQLLKLSPILYIIYFILSNILPFSARQSKNRGSSEFDGINYYGEGAEGTDRALLIKTKKEALGVRMLLLREAKKTLDIVCHTINSGRTSDAILGEILCAAERGVEVRILLDGKVGWGGKEIAKKLKALQSHPNIEIRLFNPINLLKPWRIQTLLHDKFIISDDTFVLLGGRNIGDRYYKPSNYHGIGVDDFDVLIWNTLSDEYAHSCSEASDYGSESVLFQVKNYMNRIWNDKEAIGIWQLCKERNKERLYLNLTESARLLEALDPQFYGENLMDYLMRTVPARKVTLIYNPINTKKKKPWVGWELSKMALNAADSILVQTPYATANKNLIHIIQRVSQAHVQTTMVTNSLASSPNFPAFSNYLSQRKKFLHSGVDIYEYQNKDSIHGKSFCFDDRLSAVGSFNLDDRSFYLDTETMFIIDSQEFADDLKAAVNHFKESSLRVNGNNRYEIVNPKVHIAPYTKGKKVVMYLVSVFSRMIQFLI